MVGGMSSKDSKAKIFHTKWDTPEFVEMMDQITIGDFISGLTYTQLLKVESALRPKFPHIHIIMTDEGQGWIVEAWKE